MERVLMARWRSIPAADDDDDAEPKPPSVDQTKEDSPAEGQRHVPAPFHQGIDADRYHGLAKLAIRNVDPQ
ncbi:hypothetical protein ABQF35_10970 [Mycobacterium syngnathidarum]